MYELDNLVSIYKKSVEDEIANQLLDYLQTEKKPSLSKVLLQNIYEMLLLSFLLGAEHTTSLIEASDVVEQPITYEDAVSFLANKIPMSKKEFDELDSKMKFRAFTVAKLSQLDAIERVKELLKEALSKGQTKEQLMENLSKDEILAKLGFSLDNPWYWENVFRTNIQSAYNAGRAFSIKKAKPKYLQFVGIEDSRQTKICRSRSNIIRPADDPFWSYNWPPLHFACRSTVRPVEDFEMKVYGLKSTPKTHLEKLERPQDGFGANPLESGSFYKLTPSMKKRAKQYGILDEIEKMAKRLGLEI